MVWSGSRFIPRFFARIRLFTHYLFSNEKKMALSMEERVTELIRIRKYEKALKVVEFALLSHNNNPKLLLLKSLCYFRLGKNRKAIAVAGSVLLLPRRGEFKRHALTCICVFAFSGEESRIKKVKKLTTAIECLEKSKDEQPHEIRHRMELLLAYLDSAIVTDTIYSKMNFKFPE